MFSLLYRRNTRHKVHLIRAPPMCALDNFPPYKNSSPIANGTLMYDVKNPEAVKSQKTSKPLIRINIVNQNVAQMAGNGCSCE